MSDLHPPIESKVDRCHACGMSFAAGEFFVSRDLNMGACAAGAGNWVKYHNVCAPVIFHGPAFGISGGDLAALKKDAARYRWWREHWTAEDEGKFDRLNDVLKSDDPDADIDAALIENIEEKK